MKKDYLSRLNINPFLTNFAVVLALVCFSALGLQAQSDATVSVTAPAGSEADYEAIQSVFGPGITDDVSAPVIIADDGTALPSEACNPLVNDLTGAIALIDRGTCGFAVKAINAQDAGAVGVIICNTENRGGVNQPYKAITMGGDDGGVLTIPSVMIPWQQCQELKALAGSGLEATISASVLPVEPGETCDAAIEIGAGTHTVAPLIAGFGGRQLFGDVSNAAWYSYTPATTGLATVSSCALTTADTRVFIFTGTDCSFADLTIVASNDDCGDMNFASEISFLAVAGTRYWIYWDDRWDFSGFDFELSEGPLPAVDVTFNVIMDNEMVSGDGVQMVYAGPGASGLGDVSVVALSDDDGDNVWSGTISLTTLDTIGYAFVNGDVLAGGAVESVPNDCGLASGFGFNIRPLIVTSIDAVSIDPVCFSTCLGFCPDVGCASIPVVMENLDGYTLGYVGPQSSVWTTWSGAGGEGTAEDATVTDEQFFSPPHSVKIEGQNGPVDALVLLGNQTEGNWLLQFKMYVEPGRNGYYNIQDDETPGQQWNLETQFNADGTVTFAGETASGVYPQGEWFDIVHSIDLDNGVASVAMAGKHVLTWEYGPDWKIGSIDLYPTNVGPHVYYVDDIVLRPLDPCPEGAIICDGFETYALSEVSDQSANWGPWTSSPADDGVVVGDIVRTGCNALQISDADPDDQLLLLGDRTSGNYLLEWYMYVPAGKLGYYNFQKFQDNPGGQFGMQVEFFDDGTVTLDAGAADVVTFNWTPDTWMHFQHFIDLDNNWITFIVDGNVIYEWPASWTTFTTNGVKQIGSVDFFGNDNVLFHLDDVLFQQLPSLPGNLCAGSQNIQGALGQGQGNLVTAGPYDNTNYTSTSQDPDFGWECFGEPDGLGGAPSLERTMWFSFVGDGNDYKVTAAPCGDNPIGDGDTQIALYSGGCGNLTAVACNEDEAGAPDFRSSIEFTAEEGVTYYMMVDGFGPNFEQFGEYCLEVTQTSEDLVTVTLNVDMSVVDMVSPEGVHVAGNFQGWMPDATPLTDNGDGTWSYTFAVTPNQTLEYKFLNGNAWGTDEVNITEECGVDGGSGSFNRVLEVGEDDVETIFYCFDYCVTCPEVSVDEQALQAGVKVFPNPVKDLLNVRVDLPESANNLSVRMLNAFGQVVRESYYGRLQTANLEINVSDLPTGAYMIQVMDGKAQFTQSVIVE